MSIPKLDASLFTYFLLWAAAFTINFRVESSLGPFFEPSPLDDRFPSPNKYQAVKMKATIDVRTTVTSKKVFRATGASPPYISGGVLSDEGGEFIFILLDVPSIGFTPGTSLNMF